MEDRLQFPYTRPILTSPNFPASASRDGIEMEALLSPSIKSATRVRDCSIEPDSLSKQHASEVFLTPVYITLKKGAPQLCGCNQDVPEKDTYGAERRSNPSA